MPYSISQITTFNSVNLDLFEVRGARTGINNARSTGPLYVDGIVYPVSTVLYATATCTAGNTDLPDFAFSYPFSSFDATLLVPGDTVIIGSQTTTVDKVLSPISIRLVDAPTVSGVQFMTIHLADRDYLIEPDTLVNTTRGEATFTSDSSVVVGVGTQWTTDLTAGDAIQLNTYHAYFTVKEVKNATTIYLTQKWPQPTITGPYTSKRWRLNRLDYQYVKNDFTYNKNDIRWEYDATTASGIMADASWAPFTDGVTIKFSPTLKPTTAPDLMDSNLALKKVLVKSTVHDMFQYTLPAVPDPEESFVLYINGIRRDMFPNGNMDYVLYYGSNPNYDFPPPIEDRKIASVMFLKGVENVVLSPAQTALGALIFTDATGNPVPGIMPGSETILIDGTTQSRYADYVLDVNAGIGYASQLRTNEPVVKYILYQQENLYDPGISILLNGHPQKLTIPRSPNDDVLFDFQSGRMKPADKDHPGQGEEYVITYLVEGNYITEENIPVTDGMVWFRVSQYPIKSQSAIVIRNGNFLTEGVDYRVSCLTGRVVLFVPTTAGESLEVNYSPLNRHVSGITFENGLWYCRAYQEAVTLQSVSPLLFAFDDPNLVNEIDIGLIQVFNATQNLYYDITGYVIQQGQIYLPAAQAITTVSSDIIQADYKFAHEGVEYSPVEYINFYIEGGQNYLAFVNQNLTGMIQPGSFIRLTNVDSAGDSYYKAIASEFDGEDTKVTLEGSVPEDVYNPYIYFLDSSSVNFLPSPVVINPVASGTTEVQLPGEDLTKTIRPRSLLHLGTDYYYVYGSNYDSSSMITSLSLATTTINDYTSASVLGSVQYTDSLVYLEGDTILNPLLDVINDPAATVMTLNYPGYVTVTSDATALAVDYGTTQSSFLYSDKSTIGSLSTALISAGFQVNTFVSDWTSSKIIPLNRVTVTADSTTPVTSNPAVRLFDVDTTQFSVSAGAINLQNPLIRNQRYDVDYLGIRVLGDSSVEFTGRYFSLLPAKSQIAVSMKFNNKDQFYIQGISQRNFLTTVTEPRLAEEAQQQSGSVGQGGDIPGDDDPGKSGGGLSNDEYRRKDAEIECDIFNTVFDFFNGRLQAFSDEVYAAFGWKLCNNDGLLSETDQGMGTKSLNRMFPWADYTSLPPYQITCLTGQTAPYAVMGPNQPPNGITSTALFTPGDTTVQCDSLDDYPAYWTKQLQPLDLIRPINTSKNYTISTIVDSSTIVLTESFAGASQISTPYVMTAKYPLYDDDGHMGAKFIGTKSGGFHLSDGNVFDITVDGSSQSYTFQDPSNPFLALLYPVKNYDGPTIARILTSALTGARVDWEWVSEPNAAYGFRQTLVLRSKNDFNKVEMGTGAAVSKLGFTPGDISFGNMNNTDSDPEYPYTIDEQAALAIETVSLKTLMDATTSVPFGNILNRVTPANIMLGITGVHNQAGNEANSIIGATPRVTMEENATGTIILEPTLTASWQQALDAYNRDSTYLNISPGALSYDNSLFVDYEGQTTSARWILDIQDRLQIVKGLDGTMAVDHLGVGITPITGQKSFSIRCDSTNNQRILSTTVDLVPYLPTVRYSDTSAIVLGSWSGFNGFGYSNQWTPVTFSTPYQFILDQRNSTFTYNTSATRFEITWDGSRSKDFKYSSFPTIAAIKNQIKSLAGLDAIGNSIHDASSSSLIRIDGLTPISPSAIIYIDTTKVFTITVDNIYNLSYYIDSTGIGMSWDGGSKYYSYAADSTVGAMKNAINADIPGLNATGPADRDSSASFFSIVTFATAIPPDAPVYLGLRPCFVNYDTMDEGLLVPRKIFADARKNFIDDRVNNLLNVRLGQVKQNVIDEEYLLSLDGKTGNLYNWADNRFNRSNGCEARLKQIEKQIELNQASLNVSRRFL